VKNHLHDPEASGTERIHHRRCSETPASLQLVDQHRIYQQNGMVLQCTWTLAYHITLSVITNTHLLEWKQLLK